MHPNHVIRMEILREFYLRRFLYMLRSRKTHFKQKNMTNVGCFHGQHFSSFKIPLTLLAFAITLKGINTLRG